MATQTINTGSIAPSSITKSHLERLPLPTFDGKKMNYLTFKGEVQWNNNAIWKVRGDNTNEHGIIVFINSSIDMKNISFKVFSYTLCL